MIDRLCDVALALVVGLAVAMALAALITIAAGCAPVAVQVQPCERGERYQAPDEIPGNLAEWVRYCLPDEFNRGEW